VRLSDVALVAPGMPDNFYETDRALSEYLLFHYGREDELLPWGFGPRDALHYPVRCVSECLDTAAVPTNARALDLGCAVGRATFELARHCTGVTGLDFSPRFIDVASHLQRQGSFTYAFTEQGDLTRPATAVVPAEIDRARVRFEQGDATDLRTDLGAFDVVLMANLIDRLPEPRRCLARVPSLLKPGGQLILTSPCTWLEAYTPREHWLGAREIYGARVTTLDALKSVLSGTFELKLVKDLPFLIREHARKFQWSVALATVWRRR
jgi:putative 4-mercaptohistidine N1-methyltranferase